MAQEKSLFMYFNMASEATTGQLFLDFKVKMVSEHGKNLSIRSVMSNLVGKVASFASRDITFSGFQYGVSGHLGFEGQDRPKT